MPMVAIAYLLLAHEAIQESQRKRRAERRNPNVRQLGHGGRVLAADARAVSPVFRRPARARRMRVSDLAGRIREIRRLIHRGMVDPAVRQTAIAVLSRRAPGPGGGWAVAEKDFAAEARAMFYFVRANVRYTRDPVAVDTYVHPARTLFGISPGSGGGGDCDDMTIALGALLGAVGHRLSLRVGAVRNGRQQQPAWNHIWLVDHLPGPGGTGNATGPEMPLDASVDRPPGWQAPAERLYRTRDFEV